MIFGILWEMVVDSTAELKINAAKLLKTIVSFLTTQTHFHILFQVFQTETLLFTCATGSLYRCKRCICQCFASLDHSWLGPEPECEVRKHRCIWICSTAFQSRHGNNAQYTLELSKGLFSYALIKLYMMRCRLLIKS